MIVISVAAFELFTAMDPKDQLTYIGTFFVQLYQCDSQGSSHPLIDGAALVNSFHSDVNSDYSIIVLDIPISKEARQRQWPLFTVFI